MNTDNVLVGIDAAEKIVQGNFFRLTFGRTRRLGIPVELFSFQHDIQTLFDTLDGAGGLAEPVSDLAVTPGAEAAVFDVLVRPAAIGLNAAELATYFDGLRFGVSLTSMTLIDSSAVINGAEERDTLQTQLDQSEKSKDPLSRFGEAAKYLQWVFWLLLVVAVLYLAPRALKVAKSVL